MSKVKYSLKCVKPTTNEVITSIRRGQSFDLVLSVQDTRVKTPGLIRGVFAAYTDILYNSKITEASTVVTFSSDYPNMRRITRELNKLASVGAFSGSFGGLSSGIYEVVRIRMLAKNVGNQLFKLNFDTLDYPMEKTLVYGNFNPYEDSNVLPSEIDFADLTLKVY